MLHSKSEMKPVHRYHGDVTHMTAPGQNCQQLCMHYSDSNMRETLQRRHSAYAQCSNAADNTQLLACSRQAVYMHCRDCSKPVPQVHDWQAHVTTAECVCTRTDRPLVHVHDSSLSDL